MLIGKFDKLNKTDIIQQAKWFLNISLRVFIYGFLKYKPWNFSDVTEEDTVHCASPVRGGVQRRIVGRNLSMKNPEKR